MKLAKKIVGIVLAAVTVLVALFTLILTIMAFTAAIDLIDKAGSSMPEYVATQVVGYIMGGVVGIVVTIFIAITGGKGLAAAIKGKGEAIFNRVVLNVCYVFIGVTASTIIALTNMDVDQETGVKYMAWAVVLLMFVIAACVLGTIGRRKVLGPVGSHLTGGVLLVITGFIMLLVLILSGAVDELKYAKVASYDSVDAVNGLLGASAGFAYVASIGTMGFGVLNIVEGAIARRNGTKPAEEPKAEEPKAEEKVEK